MDDDDWSEVLKDHPIFSLPKTFSGPVAEPEASLELSTSTLPKFTHVVPEEDRPTPSGRQQVMVLKDADLILAAGHEIRMAAIGDSRLSRSLRKSYKTLHTPNILFEIHQMALNPSRKLLAVAGAFQVAVVVLPRSGISRLVPATIDCKSVQVGQYYHGSVTSAPIVKIEWHPWGEAGSTLMVMTMDGKLREYDISVDTEEPQQVLSFVPERKNKSFIAEDASEREVASFALGKGVADWGPLTVYAVMRSGDVYAICPYMPKNASIPSVYIHALECFVSAKQEFLSQGVSDSSKALSALYAYQHKYISALVKQLPLGSVFPASSRSISMHPPSTIKAEPMRQGPFLLQPSPRTLDGSEGGDATDIIYQTFGSEVEDGNEEETEHLGVILVTYSDGKVDVCLDVEKVEAKWEIKQRSSQELPMLAVYETIDLGLVSLLNRVSPSPSEPSTLDLLQGNHPVFFVDPLYDDTVYIYHAFGVHALHFGTVIQDLFDALRKDDEGESKSLLENSAMTVVQPILNTFSIERRSSNPVVTVSIPNDVYLTYSIFILTSSMRVTSFHLNLRTESPRSSPLTASSKPTQSDASTWLNPVGGPLAYVSLLGIDPYTPPSVLSQPFNGLPTNPRLSLPGASKATEQEFILTPDTLRYLATTVTNFSSQIHEIQLAYGAVKHHAALQAQEFRRQQEKCGEIIALMERLSRSRCQATKERFIRIQETQNELLRRLERMLQLLMEKASPELSEHETRWFEELKRMKQEVEGAGKYDDQSLAARTRMLQREFIRLMPSIKAMLEREKRWKQKQTESREVLGFSQAFELGERFSAKRTKIAKLQEEVMNLASKLDLSIGRPPSIQAE